MAESTKTATMLLKSFVFHFQKLGLDLKCSVCLDWLNKPILLPCNHIFCKSCATKPSQSTTQITQCPSCEQRFAAQEIKPSSYLGDIVTTYKCLDSAFNSVVLPLLSAGSGTATLFTTSINNLGEKHSETTRNEASLDWLPLRCPNDPVSRKRRTDSDAVDKSFGGTPANAMNQNETFQIRKLKKLKQLTGSPENILQSYGYRKQIGSHSDQAGDKCKFKEDSSDTSSTVQHNGTVCAFCHSSEITETTGPLLHYAGGKEVARDDKDFPNAVTVHRACSLWSPRVYFTNGVIKNLKSELVRASKLKCHSCGLKGAALGCFLKSCNRTYHVPCAVETPGCRWEEDGYLIFCPDHQRNKFPSENSNSKGNSSMEECSSPTQRPSQVLTE